MRKKVRNISHLCILSGSLLGFHHGNTPSCWIHNFLLLVKCTTLVVCQPYQILNLLHFFIWINVYIKRIYILFWSKEPITKLLPWSKEEGTYRCLLSLHFIFMWYIWLYHGSCILLHVSFTISFCLSIWLFIFSMTWNIELAIYSSWLFIYKQYTTKFDRRSWLVDCHFDCKSLDTIYFLALVLGKIII